MFSTFRLYLVFLLVLLQFIAPLMHAHAGETIANRGLHVPGLELYSVADESIAYETASDDSSSDAAFFGVDTGIKQSQNNPMADADNSHYLPQPIAVFTPPFSTFNIAVSPHSPPIAGALSLPAHTPRAPPAQL